MIKKQKTIILVIFFSFVGTMLFGAKTTYAYTEKFYRAGDSGLEIWSDGSGSMQKDPTLCAAESDPSKLKKINPSEFAQTFPVLEGVGEAYLCKDDDSGTIRYRLVYMKGGSYVYDVYTLNPKGNNNIAEDLDRDSRGQVMVNDQPGSNNNSPAPSNPSNPSNPPSATTDEGSADDDTEGTEKSDCQPGDDGCCAGVKTSIITGDAICGGEGESVIFNLLLWVLRIMTAGVGIAAVGGIGYGALLYTTAEGKPEQTKKAIGIITNVVIGIAAYAFMFILLNFLIPGGVFTG